MVKNQIRTQSKTRDEVHSLIEKLHPVKLNSTLVRLGPKYDGGYLVPNDLEGIEACFSPGVYNISDFEYACAEKGMKLFLADKSIDKPKIDLAEHKYEFLPKFIGVTNNDDFITLDAWALNSNISKNGDLLLQMDVEGWEYFSLLNVSNELLKRFRIIVIEFHNLHKLWIPSFFDLANEVFSKLLETHSCVHIHPNNDSPLYSHNGIDIPPLAEFTFYRNDRFIANGYEMSFPHKLDFKNVEKNNNIILPTHWYKA